MLLRRVPVTITHAREMGITHAELFRLLPRLLQGQVWDGETGLIHVANGSRQLYIRYQPEGERRIASLRLPVTQMTFDFDGYGNDEAAAFMQHFDKTYQRGGG